MQSFNVKWQGRVRLVIKAVARHESPFAITFLYVFPLHKYLSWENRPYVIGGCDLSLLSQERLQNDTFLWNCRSRHETSCATFNWEISVKKILLDEQEFLNDKSLCICFTVRITKATEQCSEQFSIKAHIQSFFLQRIGVKLFFEPSVSEWKGLKWKKT